MVLTQRDKKVFEELEHYGALNTSLIKQMQFQNCSKQALLRRLGILKKANFVNSISIGLELVWLLTNQGARVLGKEKSRKIRINKNTLEHDALLSKLVFGLKKHNIGSCWQLEHNLRYKILSQQSFRSGEKILLPDALFTANIRDQNEAIALELELNQKSKIRYVEIFKKYKNKSKVFLVWYVVKDERFGLYLQRLWLGTSTYEDRPPRFLFSILEDILNNTERSEMYSGNSPLGVVSYLKTASSPC